MSAKEEEEVQVEVTIKDIFKPSPLADTLHLIKMVEWGNKPVQHWYLRLSSEDAESLRVKFSKPAEEYALTNLLLAVNTLLFEFSTEDGTKDWVSIKLNEGSIDYHWCTVIDDGERLQVHSGTPHGVASRLQLLELIKQASQNPSKENLRLAAQALKDAELPAFLNNSETGKILLAQMLNALMAENNEEDLDEIPPDSSKVN